MRRRYERIGVAALAAVAFAASAAHTQSWRTVTSARQLQGERELSVAVQYGAGDLRVAPAQAGLLYRMRLRHDERQTRVLAAYDRAAGALRLGIEGTGSRQRGSRGGGDAAIELAPTVPTALRLEFGAGRAEVELGGMTIRSLEVATGASEATLRWSEPNRIAATEIRISSGASRVRVAGLGNARAERIRFDGGVGEAILEFDGAWRSGTDVAVEMGLGAVTLRFPRGLGVRIESRSTLSRFSPAGMERRGDAWYSPGYDRAGQRVTVRVGAALGAVNVQWID